MFGILSAATASGVVRSMDSNPVFHAESSFVHEGEKMESGWYFWNETWSDPHGPFDSEEEAVRVLRNYAAEL